MGHRLGYRIDSLRARTVGGSTEQDGRAPAAGRVINPCGSVMRLFFHPRCNWALLVMVMLFLSSCTARSFGRPLLGSEVIGVSTPPLPTSKPMDEATQLAVQGSLWATSGEPGQLPDPLTGHYHLQLTGTRVVATIEIPRGPVPNGPTDTSQVLFTLSPLFRPPFPIWRDVEGQVVQTDGLPDPRFPVPVAVRFWFEADGTVTWRYQTEWEDAVYLATTLTSVWGTNPTAHDRAVLTLLEAAWKDDMHILDPWPAQWPRVRLNPDGRVVSLAWEEEKLTGPIPSELGQLMALERLTLAGNPLTGVIPAEIGQLANLTFLRLGDTALSGQLPPELGQLTQLQELDLGATGKGRGRLTGPLPAELGQLSSLRRLDLRSNDFTEIPPELGQLTQLEELDLGWNKLTGPIPPELGNLIQLHTLHLGHNRLTGPIPPELGRLHNLSALFMFANDLTGPIPPEMAQLQSLVSLDLTDNQLTTLPPELGQLEYLKWLDLKGNLLVGIPPELGHLPYLTTLDLSYNQLTGWPPDMGPFPQLKELNLSHNQLTGSIPPQLGQLVQLEKLRLAYNLLTGPIPPQLLQLRHLKWISLDGNRLTGCLPAEWQRLGYAIMSLNDEHFLPFCTD